MPHSLCYTKVHTWLPFVSRVVNGALLLFGVTFSILQIRSMHHYFPIYDDWMALYPVLDTSSNVPLNDTTSSNTTLHVLQQMFPCNTKAECAALAQEPLPLKTIQLLHQIQQLLQCKNPQQCIEMLRSTYTLEEQEKDEFEQNLLHQQIQQAVNRSQQDIAIEYGMTPPFVNHHPAFENLLHQYQPKEEWLLTTIPDLNIVGLPKAGTTHLYRLLQSHPQVTNFTFSKEVNLLRLDGDRVWDEWDPVSLQQFTSEEIDHRRFIAQRNLYTSHQVLHEQQTRARQNMSSPNTLTVHGCLQFETVEMSGWYMYRSSFPQPIPLSMFQVPAKKYFFLFRDPADWLWSAHNFWEHDSIDHAVPDSRNWASIENVYRSPELFHELVASGNRTKAGSWFATMRRWTVDHPRRLVAMVGHANILFLRNEDMLPSVIHEGALDRISAFAHLDPSAFHTSFTSQIYNCNELSGLDTDGCGSERTSKYWIAGNRTMLPKTRQLIYLQFWEECKIWEREFGIVYPQCLHVMDSVDSGVNNR
jgi:hypothetical protein